MFPTLPDRTDCFCGFVSRVRIQNRDLYHTISQCINLPSPVMCHSFHTSKMTGTQQEQLIDHLRVLLFFIELNLFFSVVITTHRRQPNPAPAQPASPSPHHPEGEGSHRIYGSCPGYCRERREVATEHLDELITSDLPGYRNFTRMEPPREVNHQLQVATGSRLETGSYFETLIHRRKLHLTAIPLEGWKIDHLQIYTPGLQSHFERISTRVSGVPH